MRVYHRVIALALLAVFLLTACGPSPAALATGTSLAATSTADHWTDTPLPTFTSTATQTSTSTPRPTVTRFPTAKPTKTPTRRPTSTRRPTNTPQASTWDRYKRGTLKGIIQANQSEIDTMSNDSLYLNYGDKYPSLVEVTYTGEFRETSGFTQLMLLTWGPATFSQLSQDQVTDLFAQEGLFIEDGVEYWLPIQTPLIPYLKEEEAPGELVALFVIWAGATKNNDTVEWVFLVNNFAHIP